MQSLDSNPNDEEKPFSEPDDIPASHALPQDHPLLDTDVDEDEWYNEGRDTAAGDDASAQSNKHKT